MQLKEILNLRSESAAGLFMQITMRCPLSCEHCCTDSRMTSEEHDGAFFERFVDTFTPSNRPEVLLLTGGEPFLRPQLIESLVERAHSVGTRVVAISGMFFARRPVIPESIQRALDAIDHLTASLDVFHEKEVSREEVFDVLEEQINRGKQVSLQITGLGEDDPYLEDITDSVQKRFGVTVPVLVTGVGAEGRAAEWVQLPRSITTVVDEPTPCQMANWPVISCAGAIVACCNQSVVDGPAPEHLHLGQASTVDWSTVRGRVEKSAALRALRTYGPEYLASRSPGAGRCLGYCDSCKSLSSSEEGETALDRLVQAPGFRALEWFAARSSDYRSYSLAKYAHLAGTEITRGER